MHDDEVDEIAQNIEMLLYIDDDADEAHVIMHEIQQLVVVDDDEDEVGVVNEVAELID